MGIFNKKSTLKSLLRYTFFVTLILWILTTVFIVYQYLWASSKQVISKGGTLIEGIFNTTSFLPYLNNDRQSKFYQGFLFDKCLDYSIDEKGNVQYTDKLCHVTTRDYKTYYVTINTGMIRSDGVPFSIDDIYFTYNDILKENKLDLPYLERYSSIQVEMEGEKVKITFKNTTQDNTYFFTNYILPKHALIEPNLDMYQQSFAIEPIYNNCAKIKSQSTDQYSLIFDLSNCQTTNIGFYQIKNAISFDNFKNTINQAHGSIIDMYIGDETLPGYSGVQLKTNRIVTMFFNTKSPKMTVRLRRVLGGFINTNFFDGTENEYVNKYNGDILNQFLSTGTDIKTFLDRVNVDSALSKQELIEGGVKSFTGNINFTEKNKVFAMYTEDASQNFNMKFTFDIEYKKIGILYGTGELQYPKYDAKTKSLNYTISTKNNNLKPDLNTYKIYGFTGDNTTGKIQIGTLNLYNLYKEGENNDETAQNGIVEKLKIVYFDDIISNYTILRLKQIFKEHEISDYFTYEKIDDTNELEGKLIAGEYDILINSVDMGLSKDISALFATDSVTINPSQYTDARLLTLLKQYNETDNKTKVIGEINSIYANDMPILILGKQFTKLNIKDTILNKLNRDELNLYEYNRRDIVFKNISLAENIYIDREKVKDLSNFWKFIKDPNNY